MKELVECQKKIGFSDMLNIIEYLETDDVGYQEITREDIIDNYKYLVFNKKDPKIENWRDISSNTLVMIDLLGNLLKEHDPEFSSKVRSTISGVRYFGIYDIKNQKSSKFEIKLTPEALVIQVPDNLNRIPKENLVLVTDGTRLWFRERRDTDTKVFSALRNEEKVELLFKRIQELGRDCTRLSIELDCESDPEWAVDAIKKRLNLDFVSKEPFIQFNPGFMPIINGIG